MNVRSCLCVNFLDHPWSIVKLRWRNDVVFEQCPCPGLAAWPSSTYPFFMTMGDFDSWENRSLQFIAGTYVLETTGAAPAPPHSHPTCTDATCGAWRRLPCIRAVSVFFFTNSGRNRCRNGKYGPIPTETGAETAKKTQFCSKRVSIWLKRMLKRAACWPPFFCFMWPCERRRKKKERDGRRERTIHVHRYKREG